MCVCKCARLWRSLQIKTTNASTGEPSCVCIHSSCSSASSLKHLHTCTHRTHKTHAYTYTSPQLSLLSFSWSVFLWFAVNSPLLIDSKNSLLKQPHVFEMRCKCGFLLILSQTNFATFQSNMTVTNTALTFFTNND